MPTTAKKKYRLVVETDDDPCNPREDDNVGRMVCFHKRYLLGDKHNFRAEDFDGWDGLEKHLREECGAVVVLPLFLYDHSGITMSTTGFTCRWDSGQVGLVYTTEKDLIRNGIDQKNAEKLLEGEVKTYDDYLTGNVHRWTIYDEDGEIVDSCSGYLGDEEYCRAEGERTLKHLQEEKKDVAQR